MNEGQPVGMQQLTRRRVARQFRQSTVLPRPVNLIAGDGKSQMLKMHANLMRATRVQGGLDPGGVSQVFEHPVTGPRFAPFAVGDRHALAMIRMPGDGGADFPRRARDVMRRGQADGTMVLLSDLQAQPMAALVKSRPRHGSESERTFATFTDAVQHAREYLYA